MKHLFMAGLMSALFVAGPGVQKAQAGMIVGLSSGIIGIAVERAGHLNPANNAIIMSGFLAGPLIGVAAGAMGHNFIFTLEEGESLKAGAIATELSDMFPFIDDAYVLEELSFELAKAYEERRGLELDENHFEVLLSNQLVEETLSPLSLSHDEMETVQKTLCSSSVKGL